MSSQCSEEPRSNDPVESLLPSNHQTLVYNPVPCRTEKKMVDIDDQRHEVSMSFPESSLPDKARQPPKEVIRMFPSSSEEDVEEVAEAASSVMRSMDDDRRVPQDEDCGRERLKRHRSEMAGRVWIPDIWGQEDLLKDWVDCAAAFDSSLVSGKIMSARAALIKEGMRSNSGGLRIENRC